MKSTIAIVTVLVAGLTAGAAHAAPTGIISSRYEKIIGVEAGALLAQHFGARGSNMVVGIMLGKAAKYGLIEAGGSKYCPTFSFKDNSAESIKAIQNIFTSAANMKKNKCQSCRLFAGYTGADKIKSTACTGNRCPQEAIQFSLERAIRESGRTVRPLNVQAIDHAGPAGAPAPGGNS